MCVPGTACREVCKDAQGFVTVRAYPGNRLMQYSCAPYAFTMGTCGRHSPCDSHLRNFRVVWQTQVSHRLNGVVGLLSSALCRFLQLTQAKDFLLDPYQRRAFNEAHGFLTPTVNVAWWPRPQVRCCQL